MHCAIVVEDPSARDVILPIVPIAIGIGINPCNPFRVIRFQSGAPRGVRLYISNTFKDERTLQPNWPFRLKIA